MHTLKNKEYDKNAFMGRVEMACKRYGLGYRSMRTEAQKAGAVVKIGRSVLINYETMDEYFRTLAKGAMN